MKSVFFDEVNTIVDWRPISNIINKHYVKGTSAVGCPAYPGLMLFKMALLQTWYGLSDYEVEDRLNDSISFSRFVGLSIDDKAPDHSVLSRFRTEMTVKGVYAKLFKELGKQLEKHKIIIKSGAIVDASVTESPLKPRGKTTYELATDREDAPRNEQKLYKENAQQKRIKTEQPGVDNEGRWIKKMETLDFGHGRIETRRCSITTDLGLMEHAQNWTSFNTLIRVDSEQCIKSTGEVQISTRLA